MNTTFAKFSISLVILLLAAASGFALTSKKPQAEDSPGIAMAREDIEEIIYEYLMENPEAVVESLNKFQQQQAVQKEKEFKTTLDDHKEFFTNNENLPYAGNPDGDIAVVEFFDYNCGYCKRAIPDIKKLLETDKNVKFVFVDMPILSAESMTAARYSLAAFEQGSEKYFEFHSAMMQHRGRTTPESIEKLAEKVGLDVELLKKDVKDVGIMKQIEKNIEAAQKLGVRGTPAFIVGDSFSPGYIGHAQIAKMIEENRDN